MADIELRMEQQVIVVQGAMGTMLLDMGFEGCLPFLNLTEPETIEELHRRYRAAGADCAVTNAFLATPSRLAEFGLAEHMAQINKVAVRLARRAGFPHVLGSIGPCGLSVEPGSGLAALRAQGIAADEALTSAGEPPIFAAAVEEYAAAAAALSQGKPDGLLLESFVSLDDALAALIGARRATGLPVFVNMTFSTASESATPVDPAFAARTLVKGGAVSVGCNCMDIASSVRAAREMRSAVDVPLLVRPSAGYPERAADGSMRWPAGPDEFAQGVVELVRAGAYLVGSCCGSTPVCTGAIYAEVGGLEIPDRE